MLDNVWAIVPNSWIRGNSRWKYAHWNCNTLDFNIITSRDSRLLLMLLCQWRKVYRKVPWEKISRYKYNFNCDRQSLLFKARLNNQFQGKIMKWGRTKISDEDAFMHYLSYHIIWILRTSWLNRYVNQMKYESYVSNLLSVIGLFDTVIKKVGS